MKIIGITVLLAKPEYSVWENGVRQNLVYLAQTLKAIGSYKVFLVNMDPNVPVTPEAPWDINKFRTVQFADVQNKLDVLIVIGSTISPAQGKHLKSRGTKIVYYPCGNRYIMDMESILFKDGGKAREDESYYDEIWLIPQHDTTNTQYLEALYRIPVRSAPFVWSPLFIDTLVEKLPNKGVYSPSSKAKRVSCFEPNINVVKYCISDILIVEKAYRCRPDLIQAMYVTNTDTIKKSALFISLVKNLEIIKNKVASFESRYRMPIFLSKYTDIVVAHQWENPLNNAYIETLYLKYPLVHNAPLIREAGYYFENFDLESGAQQLLLAAEHHAENQQDYERRSQSVIAKYRFDNPETLRRYEHLITELLASDKH